MHQQEEHCTLTYHGKKAPQSRKGVPHLEDWGRLGKEGEKLQERTGSVGFNEGWVGRGCGDQKTHVECFHFYQGSNFK